jgi:GNAT superfamily N-acetyltransferase
LNERTKEPQGRTEQPTAPLTAARGRLGWAAPAGGRIRLIRPGEADAADTLLHTAGVELGPYLRRSLTKGSLASVLMAGLDGSRQAFRTAAMTDCAKSTPAEALPSLSLALVTENENGEVVGVLTAMPSATLINMALDYGHTREQSVATSLVIAKIQGLAVAEHARGQGRAAALLKRTWQVYQQLGFQVVYGSFGTERALENFYVRQGYSVHAPGERLALERVNLPFHLHAEDDERMFSRWRPHG